MIIKQIYKNNQLYLKRYKFFFKNFDRNFFCFLVLKDNYKVINRYVNYSLKNLCFQG